ncbi:S8 family serine peptidase [Butyrivibrio sp. MC2013]|uniref:S8 family serine peptidase n=1 Tax=Butyrivibrio sp. MC2013 TaxID=1280686 RepID=UPI000413678A|nr:S8 family serine peptidase [Butyrivibrio sp. MC2013]
MKRKKLHSLLAGVLAFSMLLGEGSAVYAASASTDGSIGEGIVEVDNISDTTSEEDTDDENLITQGEEAATENEEDNTSSETVPEEAGEDNTTVDEDSDENANESEDDTQDEKSSEEEATESEDETADEEPAEDTENAEESKEAEEAEEAKENELEEEALFEDEDAKEDSELLSMGDDYQLTSDEQEVKDIALENKDEFSNFLALIEGVDYVEDEVVTLADTQEHAEDIAAAYGGSLDSFDNGVAVIDLSESEISVAKAYECAFDATVEIPVVSPNYIRKIEDPAPITVEDTSTIISQIIAEAGEEDNEDNEDTEGEMFKASGDATLTSSSNTWIKNWGKLYNDPYLNPTDSRFQWHHDMIGTFDAWGSLGADGLARVANVKVGVIDSGVAKHGEFNYAKGDGTTRNTHGTHVAGLIAAKKGNSTGGAGIAPGAKVYAYNSDLTSGDIMRQLRNAKEDKVDVINMSFGGIGFSSTEEGVMKEVYKAGITLIAAMGNDSANTYNYPAGSKYTIAVTSVNESGTRSDFSTYGNWADIAAPGSNIWSTSGTGSFEEMSGTSMAAPIVTGACALYMSKAGHVSPSKMKSVLKSTATKGAGSGMGAGIVNVYKMVKSAKAVKTTVTPPKTTPSVPAVSKVTISAAAGAKLPMTYDYVKNSGSTLTLNAKAVDSKKKDLTTNSAVKYEWKSSNANVVKIASENKAKSVNLTAVSAGTAKITVKVKTDSMKSAKSATYTVKVSATKVISSVSITDAAGKTVKKASLYTGATPNTITVYAKLLDKSKNVVKYKPLWTSSNSKVATVTDGKITAVGKGTATITAAAKDGSGKKAKIKVTVKQAVTEISISGQKYIAPGTSAKYTAKVNKNASSKAVTWTITGDPAASINASSGKVKLAKTIAAGKTLTITATAKDNGHRAASFNVTTKAKATKVTASSTSVTLGVIARGNIKTSTSITATADNGTDLVWSSSNSKAVSISQSGNKVTINALKPGSSKVTAKAQDGSGKKVTVKVKVITPVSKITLSAPNGRLENYLATGSSLKLKANIGNTYGKPSNKNVIWSYELYTMSGMSTDGKFTGAKKLDNQEQLKKAKAFAKVSSGKVTTNSTETFIKNINKYINLIGSSGNIGIRVTATAADGSGCSDSEDIMIITKTTSMGFRMNNGKLTTKAMFSGIIPAGYGFAIDYYQKCKIGSETHDADLHGQTVFSITSSNPKVATAVYAGAANTKYGTADSVGIIGLKSGTSTITIKTMDGSNKSCSILVRVSGNSFKSTYSSDFEYQHVEYVDTLDEK